MLRRGVSVVEGLLRRGITVSFLVLVPGAWALQGTPAVSAQEFARERLHRVGPLTVFVLPQPEAEFLCRLRLPEVRRNRRVLGCYLPDSQTIITVPDPYILIHELRHHFEGRFHD